MEMYLAAAKEILDSLDETSTEYITLLERKMKVHPNLNIDSRKLMLWRIKLGRSL